MNNDDIMISIVMIVFPNSLRNPYTSRSECSPMLAYVKWCIRNSIVDNAHKSNTDYCR